MPNGRPGDHPLTDITVHGTRVYSRRADDLVREIVELGGRQEVARLIASGYDPHFGLPDVGKLEEVLAGIRDRLRAEKP